MIRSRVCAAVSVALIAVFDAAWTGPAGAADSVEARAKRLHSESIVIDTHVDSIRWIARPDWKFGDRHDASAGRVDLPRLREGGVSTAFFAIDGNDEIKGAAVVEDSLKQLDVLHSLAEQYPNDVALCLTPEDIRRAKADGKIGIVLAVEGGHMIDDSLANLRTYYRLGARYMTLAHFFNTSWSDSAGEAPAHDGLTPFGKQVVREMNRLGLIVDVSHTSDETFYAAVATSQAPILASHSSVRALADHPRNMTDEMIKTLAAKGGVIQINFHAGYLAAPVPEGQKRPPVPWTTIVDHIDHVVKLVGVNYVGIASDFDGAPMPEGMEDTSRMPRITEELVRRGYSDTDVKKILGGNLLRLFEEVAAVGKKLQKPVLNPYRNADITFNAGRPMGSSAAVDIDRDGSSLWVFERCGSNTCEGFDSADSDEVRFVRQAAQELRRRDVQVPARHPRGQG